MAHKNIVTSAERITPHSRLTITSTIESYSHIENPDDTGVVKRSQAPKAMMQEWILWDVPF